MDLYTQNILFHGTQSPNKGSLKPADYVGKEVNTTCGDTVCIYLQIDTDEKITKAKFDGEGCSISQASASLLTEELIGLTVSEAKKFTEKDIYDILGVQPNPAREKCALLALKALQKALKDFLQPTL